VVVEMVDKIGVFLVVEIRAVFIVVGLFLVVVALFLVVVLEIFTI
jgi:hypothetical protein